MNVIPLIYVFLFSTGIASDNLMLSAMSKHNASLVKTASAMLMLFLLLHIQIMAFIYGGWAAKALHGVLSDHEHWFAIFLLLATVLRMYRELLSNKPNSRIVYGLEGFMGIACATFVYVFVLGISLEALQLSSISSYLVSTSSLAIMLLLGWYLGKFRKFKIIKSIKIIALVMMAAGILTLICQTT